MKKLFCCPALELFPFSTPTFSLSTPVEYSEATWKKASKCNKSLYLLSYDKIAPQVCHRYERERTASHFPCRGTGTSGN